MADTQAPLTKTTPAENWSIVRKLLSVFDSEEHRVRERLFSGLTELVERAETGGPTGGVYEIHETALGQNVQANSWLKDAFDGETLDKLFNDTHMGNYVIVRSTGERVFEAMPLYTRIGMHLLFWGSLQIRFLQWRRIRAILKDVSVREGKIYDNTDPKVAQPQIQAFIKTYKIDLKELLEPNPKKYQTFNAFFSRKLKPTARPPAAPTDPSVIVSAADSRLTVFPSLAAAKRLWVKGRHFTLPALLGSRTLARALGASPSVAVFRLAPQDYHRFHAPVAGAVKWRKEIAGEYYTVNPQAVNERLDVFTANRRSVTWVEAELEEGEGKETVPVAIVAVGAMLVGSIAWEKAVGERYEKGAGAGYFQYGRCGSSTVIVVIPKAARIQWDADILKASEEPVEVLVRAGEKIGKAGGAPAVMTMFTRLENTGTMYYELLRRLQPIAH